MNIDKRFYVKRVIENGEKQYMKIENQFIMKIVMITGKKQYINILILVF
jgi:hypothetical protein